MMHNGLVLQAAGRESRGRRMLTGFSSPMCRSPENRAACLSKRAPEVTLRLRFPGGEGNGFTPTCPQPLLPGHPGPPPAARAATGIRGPARSPLARQPGPAAPPAAASAPLANLRARPRSCPPAPGPGLPPPRACRPPGRRAGEGGPAAELARGLTR